MGSLARVAHFVRKLTDWSKPDRSVDPSLPRSGVVERNARLEHLQRSRRELKVQLAGLEADLAQLHAGFSDGALARGRRSAGGESLEESIRRSRELRDQLTNVQGELLRIERHIARERILEPRDEPSTRERTAKRAAAAASRERGEQATVDRNLDAPRRRTAMRILDRAAYSDNGQRQAVETAARGLFDPKEAVRRDAVARLGASGSRAGLELVQLTVDDPSPRVRFAALTALVGSKSQAVVRVFRRFLHDTNAQTRLAALRGLATAGHESASQALIHALEDENAEVRKTATTLLGWIPAKRSTPHLIFALRDPEESVRVAAAEALGASGDYRATLSLIRALGDPSERVQTAAELALHIVLGSEAEAVLAEALPPEERVAALKAWWRHARPELLADGKASKKPDPAEAATQARATVQSALGSDEAFESPIPKAKGKRAASLEAEEAMPAEAGVEEQVAAPSEAPDVGDAAEDEGDQFELPGGEIGDEDEGEEDGVSLLDGMEGADDQLALPGEEAADDEGDSVSLLDGMEDGEEAADDEGDGVSLLDGMEGGEDQIALPGEESEEEETPEQDEKGEEEDGEEEGGEEEGYEKLF